MELTKEIIIKALEEATYEIENNGSCDCSVDDITTENGIDISGNECWQSKSLMINGELIAEYVQHQGLTMHTDLIDRDDIDFLMDDLRIGDQEENPHHNVEGMVLSYLEDLPEGTKFYNDAERGFANEFKTIIIYPNAITNEDELEEILDGLTEITADRAASDIAYSGDAATQAYNSVTVYK